MARFALGGQIVIIRYFADTDTALLAFSDAPVVETKEIADNLYVDLDEKGGLVSMTIERADKQANISEVSFLRMGTRALDESHKRT
jgi:uncharacterized protein YuzE